MKQSVTRVISVAFVWLVFSQHDARAETVSLGPIKDNTLYESATGALSNGAGQHFFAGTTGTNAIRRGLLAFDILGNIPAGSTINSVALTLFMEQTSAGADTVRIHRALSDWGEGLSDAAGGEGGGAASTPGDATWIHTFHDSTFWLSPGGDLATDVSASLLVGGVGFYTWSDARMAADVQLWLDTPGYNNGWILTATENTFPTAKRYNSRQNPTVAQRPVLLVDFTGPVVPIERRTWGRIKTRFTD